MNLAIQTIEKQARQDLKELFGTLDSIVEMVLPMRQSVTPREAIGNIRESMTHDGVLDEDSYVKLLTIIGNSNTSITHTFMALVVVRAMAMSDKEAHAEQG